MRYLLFSLCMLFLKSTGFTQDAVAIARQYSDAVVMIVVQDAQHQNLALGSGLVIQPGKVVTNKHVIEGAKYAYALSAAGKKYAVAGIHALDEKNDLALLSIPGLLASSVRISRDSVEIGQRIYAIGNPEGLSNSISEGIVSGYRQMQGCPLYQITAPISPGSSGGPIVDNSGAVIGIAVGAITSGQNLNFAIPIKQIGKLLSSSTVQPLNVPAKRVGKSGEETTSLTEGIKVVDVAKQGLLMSGLLPNGGQQVLGISIRNNLSSPVARVKLLLVLYNLSNEPIDSQEIILCQTAHNSYPTDTDCDAVPSGLAKYYDLNFLQDVRVANIAKGERLSIRVLGYDLVE